MQSLDARRYLVSSNDMLNEIFSFFPGCLILHKVRLLDRRIGKLMLKLRPFADYRQATFRIPHSMVAKLEEYKHLAQSMDEEPFEIKQVDLD